MKKVSGMLAAGEAIVRHQIDAANLDLGGIHVTGFYDGAIAGPC
jgi:hypothetical protein